MDIIITITIILLGVQSLFFVIEKVIPDTIAAIYIEEGDQILRKEVKASPKIQVDRDYFRKLSWVLEHIWEKANDIPDRIIHYAEELEEKKMELYLKHNEEMMQFYQELCDWGKKTKSIGKDQNQEDLQKQLESYLFSAYEISDTICDELSSLEVYYLEKETQYQNGVKERRN